MEDLRKNKKKERFVWIDLEMTGLNENSCSIIQAALIITDTELNTIASEDIVIWQPDSVLNKMSPFVRDMHTKNGLLERVKRSLVSIDEAEIKIMKTITNCVGYKKGILSGNSIYLDRAFLKKHMPSVESFLHYRQIDVSSLKILYQNWFGEQGISFQKKSSHTALEDILSSISELKFYKNLCFKNVTFNG